MHELCGDAVESQRFALIVDQKLAPFSWLQSLHDPLVGFLVIEPGLVGAVLGSLDAGTAQEQQDEDIAGQVPDCPAQPYCCGFCRRDDGGS